MHIDVDETIVIDMGVDGHDADDVKADKGGGLLVLLLPMMMMMVMMIMTMMTTWLQ